MMSNFYKHEPRGRRRRKGVPRLMEKLYNPTNNWAKSEQALHSALKYVKKVQFDETTMLCLKKGDNFSSGMAPKVLAE